MKSLITRFAKDESGATAIEYGLIAAVMAVIILTAVNMFGNGLTETFTNLGNALEGKATAINTAATPTPAAP